MYGSKLILINGDTQYRSIGSQFIQKDKFRSFSNAEIRWQKYYGILVHLIKKCNDCYNVYK